MPHQADNRLQESTPTVQRPAVKRGSRKIRIGVVVSNKMRKTIVVRVSRRVRHPRYNRVITQATALKVHDETNRAAIGDWVKIMETRPLSKEKRWRLVDVLRRASTAPPVPGEVSEPLRDVETPRDSQEQETPA